MNEEPLDVIAVGAHPDDVEIGCAGSLARLVQQGYRVGIVDLTDGEPTPNSPRNRSPSGIVSMVLSTRMVSVPLPASPWSMPMNNGRLAC